MFSFGDELLKLAARVPFLHGTYARHALLKPGVGKTILKRDPNPRAVYTAMKSRRKKKLIGQFARSSAEARGGKATIAMGKMDTKKGWMPSQLTAWGKKNIGGVDDAKDLVRELESAKGARRGEIWRMLHKGTGAWRNESAAASLRPSKYRGPS